MSNTTTLPGRESAQGAAVAAVQPREITESAFRALCAAGADPAEAEEGGLAVLRAEVDSRSSTVQISRHCVRRWN